VPPEVVVSARRAHQPARRIGLEPALVLTPIPDPILRTEHPSPSLVVEDGEVAHRDSERTRLQVADAPLLNEVFVANLGFAERIDRHGGEYDV
jgi:hypothetical protein